jgi:hypothetical protein
MSDTALIRIIIKRGKKMGSQRHHTRNRKFLATSSLVSAVALCSAIGVGSAQANSLEITPSVGASISYTDNVNLVPVGEVSDTIVSGQVGLNVQGDISRLTSSFNYSYAYDNYADSSDLSGGRHSLYSRNTVELAPDIFFLDLNASIQERELDRTTIRPATARTYGGDQTRVTTLSVSPYVDTVFAGDINFIARLQAASVSYSQTDVGTGGSTLPDRERYGASVSLNNHASDAFLTWGVSTDFDEIDDDRRNQKVIGSLYYNVSGSVRLIARAGYDRSDTNGDGDNDIEQEMWRIGAEFRPTQRSSFRFEGGRRFDRTTYDAGISHEFREALIISANYSHELVTDASQSILRSGSFVYDEGGGFVGFKEVTTKLVDETYLSKSGRITASGEIGPTSYQVGLSYLDKEFEFTTNDETILRGSARVRVSLTKRIGIFAAAMISEEDAAIAADEIDILRFSSGLNYAMTDTAALSLEAVIQRYEYGTGVDIEENAVLLSISKSW